MMSNVLESWRNVITPHPDVAKGNYEDSEFMADLGRAALGDGGQEYTDAREFFLRTYLTDGLRNLLVKALKRLCGGEGNAVVQMKTAFGGGKTHSMLALYHLLKSPEEVSDLPEVRRVFEEAGVLVKPRVKVAVLGCTHLNVNNQEVVNGIAVNTLWGNIAAQVGGYDFVREADKNRASPGDETLRRMFDECGPCLVLIDELVAYARTLFGQDDNHLPAGTLGNLLTFIQHLTQGAVFSRNSLVVATLPESKMEAVDESGLRVMNSVEHYFARVESVWKPITADEGFAIVRRRLFQECVRPDERERTAERFYRMYEGNAGEFPYEARDVKYRQRIIDCYPFHPELFERLYSDWSTLEKFQRTRGVLKLLARVIHKLWTEGDKNALIMPGSLPLWDNKTREELTKSLPAGHHWDPIIDQDIDGERSTAYKLDTRERFAQLSAARRVARTIFLGSAPSERTQILRGLDISRIRLGTVQPDENISTYNDAVHDLKNELTYLFANDSRLWFDTRPTLKKLVKDLEEQVKDYELNEEVCARLRKLTKAKSVFSGVHVYTKYEDVPDEPGVRLVVLDLNGSESTAREVLMTHEGQSRVNQNMLVFLMADSTRLEVVRNTARKYIAWRRLNEEHEARNLENWQVQELRRSIKTLDEELDGVIRRAWISVVVPNSEQEAANDIKFRTLTLTSPESGDICENAAMCMKKHDELSDEWAPSNMILTLNELRWNDGDSVPVKKLWEWVRKFCYMPRLTNYAVLERGIIEGVKAGDFGLAGGFDDGRYTNLRMNESVRVEMTDLIVKRKVASAQIEAERQKEDEPKPDDTPTNEPPHEPQHEPEKPKQVREFHMQARLDDKPDPKKYVGNLFEEVIRNLRDVPGAKLRITLEVQMDDSDGVPQNILDVVTDNCKTFRVSDYEFY